MPERPANERRNAHPRTMQRVVTVAAAQDGFTLSELLVVLAILGTILAGLTVLLTSALKSQTDQTRRVNAQQDVRVALDQLRRELHCGSNLVYNSASSVTVTLPAYCTTSASTTLTGTVTLTGTATPVQIDVPDTSRFNSGTNTISFGSSGIVTCTAKFPTYFSGCTGGTAGKYFPGTAVTSPVTWCVTTSGAPYTLKRYVGGSAIAGAACTGAGGTASTSLLVSSSVFTSYTRPTTPVAAPTFAVATTGGTIRPGTYTYDVTAVTSNGEFSGTPTQVSVAGGGGSTTTNTITLSWSAYTDPTGAAATSYQVYGRDNGSTTAEGLRLLATVTAPTMSYTDTGPAITTLSGPVVLPPVSGSISVADTSKFTWSPNTIAFGSSGIVTCQGKTPTAFTVCTGGVAGNYPAGTPVFQMRTASSPVDGSPPLATLNVALVADATPGDTSQRFTLNDAISLRNSGRY